jgi:hypothetical protein
VICPDIVTSVRILLASFAPLRETSFQRSGTAYSVQEEGVIYYVPTKRNTLRLGASARDIFISCGLCISWLSIFLLRGLGGLRGESFTTKKNGVKHPLLTIRLISALLCRKGIPAYVNGNVTDP